ncbi:FGGY family carbohydrate kinase [Microbacterium sp. 179-I 3D2 NHS]|uniref:FGGY family carbohydrate kinase n=1 Tax=Microbacterium sp. 179-I 3D2 NHS TaxID=3235178 RepID=UPI0039A23834
MTLVLGLDIGSTTTKAALVEVADAVSVLHVARRPTPADIDELLSAAAEVSRACTRRADAPIAAIGIASMGESGAPLGRGGAALTPLLRWDRRLDRSHVDALLGARPELPATTGLPATTKPAAVALTALRAEQPEVHARMRHWAGAADLVAHALTGERVTDHTLAARTMLASGGAWDAALLADLDLTERMLPAIVAPGEIAARTGPGAEAFGLPRGVPVTVAGHDHAVGAWAVGARRPGETGDSLGTTEAIVRVTDAVDVAAAVADGFSVGRTVDGAALTVLAGSPACGALLARWARDHPADDVLARLSALPSDAWTASPVLVLPYPSGRQCPDPRPDAHVRVIGEGDAGDRARGLLQSLVSQARWMRETLDRRTGAPTRELTVLGSLAQRIPVWAPWTAPTDAAVFVTTAAEPVAAGAALLAATRAGAASAEVAVLPRDRVVAIDDRDRDVTYRRFLAAVTDASTRTAASTRTEGDP